jgi:hypothetical protein
MPWNWELPNWPQFNYDHEPIIQKERQFLLSLGHAFAFLKNIGEADYQQFVVEILSSEGLNDRYSSPFLKYLRKEKRTIMQPMKGVTGL